MTNNHYYLVLYTFYKINHKINIIIHYYFHIIFIHIICIIMLIFIKMMLQYCIINIIMVDFLNNINNYQDIINIILINYYHILLFNKFNKYFQYLKKILYHYKIYINLFLILYKLNKQDDNLNMFIKNRLHIKTKDKQHNVYFLYHNKNKYYYKINNHYYLVQYKSDMNYDILNIFIINRYQIIMINTLYIFYHHSLNKNLNYHIIDKFMNFNKSKINNFLHIINIIKNYHFQKSQ